MTTSQRRDFLISASTNSPDGEVSMRVRAKLQGFTNEIVEIVGNTDVQVSFSLNSISRQG